MFSRRTVTQEQREVLGQMIRDARNGQGLTQEQFAEYLSCSVHWVIQIERGKSCINCWDICMAFMVLEVGPETIRERVGKLAPKEVLEMLEAREKERKREQAQTAEKT